MAALPTVTPPSLRSPASAAGTWAARPAEALHSEGPWRKCFQHWYPSFQKCWSHEQEGWSYQKNSSTRHLFCLLIHSVAQQSWYIYSGKDDLVWKDERDAPLSPCCSLSWTGWLADSECPGPFEWTTLWAWWWEKNECLNLMNCCFAKSWCHLCCSMLEGLPCFMFWLPDWCWGGLSLGGLGLLFCQLGGLPGMGPRAWIILPATKHFRQSQHGSHLISSIPW